MTTHKSQQAGFSLVELLVAVVILAIGLLGLAELQVTAIKANSQSETTMAASSIAQGIIEQVAAMLDSDPFFDGTGAPPWPSTYNVEGAGSYQVSYTLTQNYEGVTNLCLVQITVSSTNKVMNVTGNKVRTVTATTIKRVT